VLQNEMDEIRPLDPTLEMIAGHLVWRRGVLRTESRFSGWKSIVAWCEEGRRHTEQWIAESAERGELLEGSRLPWSTLYSRAHFIASHFLAALIKIDHPQLEWEAEFSDPCSRDVTGAERFSPTSDDELRAHLAEAIRAAGFTPPQSDNANVWVEQVAYALADRIVFTNENQAEYMIGLIEDAALAERVRERATVSHHPEPPERFYRVSDVHLDVDPRKVNIGYFGNVYGTRSLVPLLDAVALLDEEDRSRLALYIYTSTAEELQEDVEERGIEDVVHVHPFVSYFDHLALTTQLDVLLAVDALRPANAPSNPFLVSKWSDYKGSGRAIWLMYEESSVLARMDHPALVYRTPTDHMSAALQLLATLARTDPEEVRRSVQQEVAEPAGGV
jgi:glycosyltransferase involved in cell wall biosynthesis